MFRQRLQSVEKRVFRTLNSYLEPVIRTGVGSPGFTPVGAVVLETTGRKSGLTFKTPVLASEFADLLLISTVRSGSQWVKNLAAAPQTQVWLRGQSVPVMAYVIGPEIPSLEALPETSPVVRFLIQRLRRLSKLTGTSFAILDRRLPQLSGG